MLEIINSLKPFFEDNYRRINVREYARMQKISPPTASRLLDGFHNSTILKKELDRQYIYYYANKESDLLISLSRIYWTGVLEESGLTDFIEKEFLSPVIILFGSLSKAEAKADSDIDIAVFSPTKREVKFEKYEKLLKRKIQLFIFQKREHFHQLYTGYILFGHHRFHTNKH